MPELSSVRTRWCGRLCFSHGETLRIEELDVCFGAHVHDVALASLSSATFAPIREALLEYGFLVFPGQHISLDEQNTFAAMFGPLEFRQQRSRTSMTMARF